ncbi:hypothetical protein [Undibacterium sp.]|uniref:hypothetical protein n=1 Tax=Undibacterium sp. TaxID=1914977 RepID=UPI00272FBFE0|nr:hypothetical protein [Undibacterium sp.]MDP1979163.1 hypothetical protein [Undibacterium sp.]
MRSINRYPYYVETDWKAPAELFTDPNEYRQHIEYFTKCLIIDAGAHFSANQDRRIKKIALHASFSGAYLINTLLNPLVTNKQISYQTERNPYVKITLKIIELFELEKFPLELKYMTNSELLRWVEVLNNCVEKIRYEVNDPDMQEKIADLQKRESINYTNLLNQTTSIYQKRTKFSLFFANFISHDYHPDVPTHSDNPHVDYKKTIGVIESMIKSFTSGSWSHSYIDSAWKINYFYRDRLCFDILIFLDDTNGDGDESIQESLANYWREETGGIGRFTGSSLRGNVLIPIGEKFINDPSVMAVVKEMTSLTHSVLEMANGQGGTQGIRSHYSDPMEI